MPPAILDPQIEILRWLSEYRNPYVNGFFLAISGVGSTLGYMVLLPILWWGSSWKLGARLFVALVLSIYVNALIKDAIGQPRPFLYADVESVTRPDEFSFPSGHAQHAALVWGLMALYLRKRWVTVLAAAMTVLIGFSRVQLGVHFPTDVVAGWLIGGILAHAYLRWSPAVTDWAEALSLRAQMLFGLGTPALLTVVHGTRFTAMAMGGLAGALGGLAAARRKHLYSGTEEAPPRRRDRLLVGLIGLPILYLALLVLSPSENSPFYYFYLWMRFAAIGLWVSFLTPRLVSLLRNRLS